jgi:hypothetical protein
MDTIPHAPKEAPTSRSTDTAVGADRDDNAAMMNGATH